MSFGLNTAVSGLLTAKRGLYTASHNIDNTTTPGYSRQRIYQSATNAHQIPKDGFLGTGTSIDNIGRVRNSFIDFKYWYECAPTAEWSSKNETLDEVQKILGEPSNASFNKYMDDFYDSLNNLKKNPGDLAYREPVRENAKAFARHINETASKLLQLQKDTLQETQDVVDKVNSLAHQIANLNRQIYEQEIDGRIANDLRDRRDLIVDELSKYVSVSVSETYPTAKNGKPEHGSINNTEPLYGNFDVSVGGISLVNHIHVNEISLKKENILPPPDDGHDVYAMYWENGSKVHSNSGKAKSLLDLYNGDGKDGSYRGIRFYRNKLDEFAYGFAKKFNEQHQKGYSLGENGADGTNGIDFFQDLGANKKDAAMNLQLSKDILKDIKKIAAAEGKEGKPEDNKNLLALIQQREDVYFFNSDVGDNISQGTPDDFIKSVISIVGVDKQQSNRFETTQKMMEKNLENRRQSVSGVNLNEEMGDMVKYQKVYTAAAKMISTMDQLLDLTVNRLGMVGR